MHRWFCDRTARTRTLARAPRRARDFHQGLPGYAATPLIDVPSLSVELGVRQVLVKDESSRMGLPAFKILGASWASHQVIERHPGARLVTATDGNHGRAIARIAGQLGSPAIVFVPSVMQAPTADLIRHEGATVIRVDGDYDEAVRVAADFAANDPDSELVQDTAWEGYEEVPQWIVDGYDTLLAEVDEQLGRTPDLVVVPAGVGSLAQAVVAHYRGPGMGTVSTMVVEPDTAACVIESLLSAQPASVPTQETVMAGLNCGTISALAWPVLRDGCDAAITVSDADAVRASDDLESLGVSSGACGAATLAGARAALENPDTRAELDLPPDAVVVLLSTEGRAA